MTDYLRTPALFWSFSCLSSAPCNTCLCKNMLGWHLSAGQLVGSTGNHHLLPSLQKPEIVVQAACCGKSMRGTRSPMVVTRIILSMGSPWMCFAAAQYWIWCTRLTVCVCREEGFTALKQSVEHLQQESTQPQ